MNSEAQITYVNREWVREMPISSHAFQPTSTIVCHGDLLITGNKINISGNSDIYSLRIDSNGDTLWQSSYNWSASQSMDYGIELQGSTDGFIYLVGGSEATIDDWDLATIRYNRLSGSFTTPTRTNIIGATIVEATSMVCDDSKNVYITGYAQQPNKYCKNLCNQSFLRV
ncbi:MAG: hypothetical protein IPM74_16370 [Crocinitomicaceae bacterium]|nr:hypothetical protein [Crocinitomicaceae bacterium]